MNEPRLIAVDWSGRNDAEQRQAIWLAEVIAGELVRLEGGRTRTELIELLIAEADRDPNLIVGFDFAFSLPAWYLQDRQLTPHQLWALLADEALTPAMRRHGLARWMNSPELPFWTTSESHARLRPEQMFRRTENDMRLPGVQPKSVFQLVGAGQVGRGSLYGMQALHRLAGVGFRIWPFDPPGLPLVVEIFPRILTGPVRKNNPSERERYVEAVPIPPDLRRLAAASEDAFDAAVSAVVMAGGVGELRALPEALGYEVEGMIWRPHHRVVLGIGGRHKGKADPVPVWLVVGSGGRCDRLRDPLDHDRHEAGVAAGWLDELLSERGRTLARELGRRRRNAGLLMRDWPRRGFLCFLLRQKSWRLPAWRVVLEGAGHMRRRIWIIGVLAGVLALTATAAQAVSPGQVGRVDRTAYQLGNPALGAVHVAVAGELVNTDADADADALRGAVRISKLLFALRVQTQAELHRIEGGAWHVVVRGPVVNSGTASNALSKTPLVQFCDVVPTPPTQTTRTYRVVSRNSVRWSNTGRLSNFNVPTTRFVAPILLNDPACIQPG